MKHIKKLLALVLALAICAAFALPAVAAENEFTLTINEPLPGHVYEVYQIYSGTVESVEAGQQPKLSNIAYGQNYVPTGHKEGEKLDDNALKDLSEKTDGRAFALELESKLTGKPFTTISNTATGEGATPIYQATVLGGYYLIKDISQETDPEDAYSQFIMQVVDNQTITPKNSTPTVDKKVEEKEVIGVNVNESLDFTLTATLDPDLDYGAYQTYKVQFNDTMSKGITFDEIKSVTITETDGEPITLMPNDYATSENLVKNAKGPMTWTLTIADLKTAADIDITKGVEIKVVYSGHLNEEAQFVNSESPGYSGTNKVSLTYSNEPDGSGEGTTPEKPVYLFSFGLDNFKYVTEDGEKVAKEGAGFTLYDNDGNVVPVYKDGSYYYVYDGKNLPTDFPNAMLVDKFQMVSDDKGHFDIRGLKEGTYTMKETKTPNGYNTCSDIEITIQAEYEEVDGVEQVKTLTITKDGGAASSTIEIENKKGSLLPSTGGIGTTIFYTVGAILVVGAGVLLFTKRRMSKG